MAWTQMATSMRGATKEISAWGTFRRSLTAAAKRMRPRPGAQSSGQAAASCPTHSGGASRRKPAPGGSGSAGLQYQSCMPLILAAYSTAGKARRAHNAQDSAICTAGSWKQRKYHSSSFMSPSSALKLPSESMTPFSMSSWTTSFGSLPLACASWKRLSKSNALPSCSLFHSNLRTARWPGKILLPARCNTLARDDGGFASAPASAFPSAALPGARKAPTSKRGCAFPATSSGCRDHTKASSSCTAVPVTSGMYTLRLLAKVWPSRSKPKPTRSPAVTIMQSGRASQAGKLELTTT
mmetsp:Transcript_84962/g.214334  ORF Transcript_84962/g.214334 Transcript_84962/m.214334 type:complete len:296 (-) Transcript_84962:216-1103(-)